MNLPTAMVLIALFLLFIGLIVADKAITRRPRTPLIGWLLLLDWYGMYIAVHWDGIHMVCGNALHALVG